MIYGAVVEISGGEEGRWHRERLERSPFLYRSDATGQRSWNPDFEEGGHYSSQPWLGAAFGAVKLPEVSDF